MSVSTVHLYTNWGFESLVIVNWNDRASKNCWVTLASRNIDHYPLLIKTIFNAQGVRFSSDNGLAQGGTPSASVPRQQISIRIVQKSLNKKPPSLQCLLYFAGPASVDRAGSRELCGVWTLISTLQSCLLDFSGGGILRHYDNLLNDLTFIKLTPAGHLLPSSHPLLSGQTRGDIHYYPHWKYYVGFLRVQDNLFDNV